MLKYHLLVPNRNQLNIGIFNHYLSLGSHEAPYVLDNIQAFSIITLNPKQKLPTIDNNREGKFSTLAIPLKGKLKVNSHLYQQPLNEKQILIWNPKDISSVEGDQNPTTFAYIAFKGEQINSPFISLKKYESKTVVDIEKSIAFVLNGKITYQEGDIQVTLKNKLNFDELPNLFYTRKSAKLQIEENSLVLIVADKI